MDKMSEEWFRADGHCSLFIVHCSLLLLIRSFFRTEAFHGSIVVSLPCTTYLCGTLIVFRKKAHLSAIASRWQRFIL